MRIHPLVASLFRHRTSATLVILQVAITLAVTMNAIYLISIHIAHEVRPTGLKEQDLAVISQAWVGAPSFSTKDGVEHLDAMQKADLETLRAMPHVSHVSAISSVPLLNEMRMAALSTKPEHAKKTISALYYGDQDSLETLGIELVDGRNFRESEVKSVSPNSPPPSIALITEATAKALFGSSAALGRVIYINGGGSPTTVIGIIKLLQTPNTSSWGDTFAYQSVLAPGRMNSGSSRYILRADHGFLPQVMKRARSALFSENPMRTVSPAGISSFKQIRRNAYRSDKATAELLTALCAVLLLATAGGIGGLSSFWVGQRRRQIGLRRALGATRRGIMIHFLLENALLCCCGVALGLVASVFLQTWLMQRLEIEPMPVPLMFGGSAFLFLLSQASALTPALKAASVEPMEASRSI